MSYRDLIAIELDEAKAWSEKIDRDPTLTDVGKAQQRAAKVQPAIDGAREMAAAWLSSTQIRAEKARQRHRHAVRLAGQNRDTQAASYAFQRAKTLAETASWDVIARDMAEAAEVGDENRLSAWRDLRGLVGSKFDSRSGPASDVHTGLRARLRQVDEALAAVPPDPVVAAAAQELAEAEAAAAAARSDLSRADFRRGVVGEEKLFGDILSPSRTVTTGGPDDALGWVIETQGGGGAFG